LPSDHVLSAPVVAITRTVTVAAGRFAPGHLGELRAVVPFELIDAVLQETCSVQRRPRDLPSRVGVYFLLAMCLFPEVGYRLVWDKLTARSRDDRHTAPTQRRRHRILALLQEDPTHLWRPRDIAAHFGDVTLDTMYGQLSRWAETGLIHKIGPGLYAATTRTSTPLA
jgi:hypothetical protein